MLTQNSLSPFQKKFWCPGEKFKSESSVYLSAKGMIETQPMSDNYNDCF